MKKDLSERKQKILNALVDDYILSAQPVSSKDIQTKYMPEVSSATIRSELAALEDLGFIEQPHTSSGRVPLPEAYRHYVEKAVQKGELLEKDVELIKERFNKSMSDIRTLSAEAAKIISDTTNYTSVFIANKQRPVAIREIKLVPMSNNTAVVIVLTDSGVLNDKTVQIPDGATVEGVETASRILNKVFSGKTLEDIDRFPAEIETELKGLEAIFNDVVVVLKSYFADTAKAVHVEGALKILDYPEYTNTGDAKRFLQVLSDEKTITELVESNASDIEYSIKIGRDADGGIDNCAMVTAEYKINGKVFGQAGVIGPERMDYKRVLNVLECVKQSLATVLKKDDISGDDKQDVNVDNNNDIKD